MFQRQMFRQNRSRVVEFQFLECGDVALPTLLFLHGAGAKGDDLGFVEQEPLPRLVKDGLQIPFRLICPQCPAHLPGWPVEELLFWLEHLIPNQKIAVTGLSMGGRGAWELAYRAADKLAALVPLCGPSLPTLAPRLGKLSVWAFHGENDAVVPIERTAEMIEALHSNGNSARFSRLEGAGHDIGDMVYARAELWQWLSARFEP